MSERRTDLALEAQELFEKTNKGKKLPGLRKQSFRRSGCRVHTVEVTDADCATALGKPIGRYVTVELPGTGGAFLRYSAAAVAEQLRALLPPSPSSALVVGLGNDDMTPDAFGPMTLRHVLVTRHLAREFPAFFPVGTLTPLVLARTGLEAQELVRGAVETLHPSVVIAVDALAARSLHRVCATVQLSDAGIVPGSGVGNARRAFDRETLGVPVVALGVPTVVDASTLALDLLEEAGAPLPDPEALRGADVFVTPRDIDAKVRELSRLAGYAIDLALQHLSFDELSELLA